MGGQDPPAAALSTAAAAAAADGFVQQQPPCMQQILLLSWQGRCHSDYFNAIYPSGAGGLLKQLLCRLLSLTGARASQAKQGQVSTGTNATNRGQRGSSAQMAQGLRAAQQGRSSDGCPVLSAQAVLGLERGVGKGQGRGRAVVLRGWFGGGLAVLG